VLEAEDFSTIPGGLQYRRRQARRIHSHYLKDKARMKVQVDASLLEEIEKGLEDPPVRLFAKAQEVLAAQLDAVFVKYKESPEYAAYRGMVEQTNGYLEVSMALA
jgi:DNA-binding XRE family transcriptional regulator